MTEAARGVKSIVLTVIAGHSGSMTRAHRRLRSLFAVPVLAAVLAGCGPVPVYYREGADVQRLKADTLSCQVSALEKAPVANEIRQRPPVYYPGGQYCRDGNCWSRPGYWVDGGIYTVDVNQGLRRRLEQSCMAKKGYQEVPLRRCTTAEVGQRLAGQSSRLPPLTGDACVWKGPDNTLHVLTP